MREIEKKMLRALSDGKTMRQANTEVDEHANIYLHGNHIATVDGIWVMVNVDALRKWPTMTTRSRLRALGVNLESVRGTLHIDKRSIYSLPGTVTIVTTQEWRDYVRS